jgi:hypothetical protein
MIGKGHSEALTVIGLLLDIQHVTHPVLTCADDEEASGSRVQGSCMANLPAAAAAAAAAAERWFSMSSQSGPNDLGSHGNETPDFISDVSARTGYQPPGCHKAHMHGRGPALTALRFRGLTHL